MFFGQSAGDIFLLSKFPSSTSNENFESSVAASFPEAVEFHCGIFIDEHKIIHSTPHNGVVEEKLIDVIEKLNPDKLDILSVKQPNLLKEKAVTWAKSQLGCNYNYLFTPYNCMDDEKKPIYCSQLIVYAYKYANNDSFIFEEIIMRFTDDKGKTLKFWIDYFDKHKAKIPDDKFGSHPGQFKSSKYSKLIFSKLFTHSENMLKTFLQKPNSIFSTLNFVSNSLIKNVGSRTLPLISPRDGSVLSDLPLADSEFCSKVVSIANNANGEWKKMSMTQKSSIFLKVGRLLRENVDLIAKIETIDNGKPIREAVWDVLSAADCVEYFASADISGRHFPLDQANGKIGFTKREPFGVVCCIGAWNYPIQTAMWKIAPALICGNSVIYKPSPLSPVSPVILGILFEYSGLSSGVLNIIQGDSETGKELCLNENVSKVSFTGSVSTGQTILNYCSSKMIKPATMELGGKSSLIICEDADIKNAVYVAMMANFFSQGQVCSNASKVLVHKNILSQFTKLVVDETKKLVVGDPLSSKTHIGACISLEHMKRVKNYIDNSIQLGAQKLYGGEILKLDGELENGYYLSPCILTNINSNMKAYHEEIFGAVMMIIPYDDDDEALQIANETIYGLAAGVFTNDLKKANHFIDNLIAGNVYVNTYNDTAPQLPFGGMKQSGYGREQGHAAIDAFSQIKSVYLNTSGKVTNPF
uniref:Aldehyde dehydrogenase family 1 member A3 (inferred by orthology to a human protein) n=1 Tax=Strongyloides venezuelensis TaxID=75913 RepID=A0A0K0G1K8_STRVS